MEATLGGVNSQNPGLILDVLPRELLQAPLLPLALLDQLPHDQPFAQPGHDEEEDTTSDDQEHRQQPQLPRHGDHHDGHNLKTTRESSRIMEQRTELNLGKSSRCLKLRGQDFYKFVIVASSDLQDLLKLASHLGSRVVLIDCKNKMLP